MAEPSPDWPQVVELYTLLITFEPTPVVRLNHAVALAETGNCMTALAIIDALRAELVDFQPFQAAEAAILAMSGDTAGARAAFQIAIENTTNEGDRLLLLERCARLE